MKNEKDYLRQVVSLVIYCDTAREAGLWVQGYAKRTVGIPFDETGVCSPVSSFPNGIAVAHRIPKEGIGTLRGKVYTVRFW